MFNSNYNDQIEHFFRINPRISTQKMGVLLILNSLYKSLPPDISSFREVYAHLDPNIIESNPEGITFLNIARTQHSLSDIRERLNSYFNIKFHDINHPKRYADNMVIFKKYSMTVSEIIEDVLRIAEFPEELYSVLKELKESRECYDACEMLELYKNTENKRLKFELLRKLGLIVLIARIKRTYMINELDQNMRDISKALDRKLGVRKKKKIPYYFWLDSSNKAIFYNDKKRAESAYAKDVEQRKKLALEIYPMQEFECHSFRTRMDNEILHMSIRNKFKKNGNTYFTSFVEKMIRKNLAFPNQVHDVIGLKVVVDKEDEIKKIIREFESFLGGSSTRKNEINTYHKFGRKHLNKHSSKDYFVWKAIYDITLSHPSIEQIDRLLALTKDNEDAQKELKERYKFFIDNPKDFVVELQLQDIKSHLQSISEGSHTEHLLLKKNQIRSDSYYKFFPKEIYEKEINKLKIRILGNNSSEKPNQL